MRSSRPAGIAAVVLVWLASASKAEVVERVLAVVDGRALCLSDVAAVAALDKVGRDTALTRVVDETLLFQEAYRLPQAALTEDEEHALVTPASGDAARRRALRRRAVIRKYVVFRFQPQVRIEDAAVRRAYAEEVARGEAPPFENVEASLRERLTEREVQARVASWTRDLRAAAQVRYNPPDPE